MAGWLVCVSLGSHTHSSAVDTFDEPPLLEELGINVPVIFQRTILLLNPLKAVPKTLMEEGDLAGPLLYCLILGSCLFLVRGARVCVFLMF